MDCFGTYFTHVQTCDNVRVHSAMQWTASVHTLHLSKPVMFTVLRNGLLRYILYKGFLGSKVSSKNNAKEMNPRLKTYVFAYMFRRNADNVWYETGKLCK